MGDLERKYENIVSASGQENVFSEEKYWFLENWPHMGDVLLLS